jgi:hypothetical protein
MRRVTRSPPLRSLLAAPLSLVSRSSPLVPVVGLKPLLQRWVGAHNPVAFRYDGGNSTHGRPAPGTRIATGMLDPSLHNILIALAVAIPSTRLEGFYLALAQAPANNLAIVLDTSGPPLGVTAYNIEDGGRLEFAEDAPADVTG